MNITPFLTALKHIILKQWDNNALRKGSFFWQNTSLTKGVGSLQLIGKLFCWRQNVWVIVSLTITTILHLMKELCPIPLCWVQNVSQSTIYCCIFLTIVVTLKKTCWNRWESVSTWFFKSFHEWNVQKHLFYCHISSAVIVGEFNSN